MPARQTADRVACRDVLAIAAMLRAETEYLERITQGYVQLAEAGVAVSHVERAFAIQHRARIADLLDRHRTLMDDIAGSARGAE